MHDYLYEFLTKEQCDRFDDYLEEEELWRERLNEKEIIVVSIFEETADDLYKIAATI